MFRTTRTLTVASAILALGALVALPQPVHASDQPFIVTNTGSFVQDLAAGTVCSFPLEIAGTTTSRFMFHVNNGNPDVILQSYHGEGTLTNLANGVSAEYHQAQQDRGTFSFDPTTQIQTITVVSSGELFVPIPGIQGGGKDTNNVGRTTTIYYQAFGSAPAPPPQYSADVLGDTANICAALS